jgi:hypothetical protein
MADKRRKCTFSVAPARRALVGREGHLGRTGAMGGREEGATSEKPAQKRSFAA